MLFKKLIILSITALSINCDVNASQKSDSVDKTDNDKHTKFARSHRSSCWFEETVYIPRNGGVFDATPNDYLEAELLSHYAMDNKINFPGEPKIEKNHHPLLMVHDQISLELEKRKENGKSSPIVFKDSPDNK